MPCASVTLILVAYCLHVIYGIGLEHSRLDLSFKQPRFHNNLFSECSVIFNLESIKIKLFILLMWSPRWGMSNWAKFEEREAVY